MTSDGSLRARRVGFEMVPFTHVRNDTANLNRVSYRVPGFDSAPSGAPNSARFVLRRTEGVLHRESQRYDEKAV